MTAPEHTDGPSVKRQKVDGLFLSGGVGTAEIEPVKAVLESSESIERERDESSDGLGKVGELKDAVDELRDTAELGKAGESNETGESKDPVELRESVELGNAVGLGKAAELRDAAESRDTAELGKAGESNETGESKDRVELDETVKSSDPLESGKSAELRDAVEGADSRDTAELGKVVESGPIEPGNAAESINAAGLHESAETRDSVELGETVETTDAVEINGAVETSDSVEISKPAQTTDTVKSGKAESGEVKSGKAELNDQVESESTDSTESTWLPNSITTIVNKFQFNSSTYHSPIPKAVAESNEPVVLGVDEAGRGPVLGPMVYGISYCLASYQPHLKKKYGFADSKTLKDDKRQSLFRLIETLQHELNDSVGWATTTMTAKDISSGMLQDINGKGGYNLNEQAHDVTIELVRQVLNKGVKISSLFVDTVGPPSTYQAKLKHWFPEIAEVVVTKKADSIYPIVSTASVVAKVTRDLNLHFFNERVKVLQGQALGSGYPSDPNTSRWLNSHVDPVFGWWFGIVRFSWQTAKDSLVNKGGVPVIYEAQVLKPDKGYQDVSGFFTAKSESDEVVSASYYGDSEVSL